LGDLATAKSEIEGATNDGVGAPHRPQTSTCTNYWTFVQYSLIQEIAMGHAEFRLTYQPKPDRLPRWMQRLWAWF
jgi:hypothetical protein